MGDGTWFTLPVWKPWWDGKPSPHLSTKTAPISPQASHGQDECVLCGLEATPVSSSTEVTPPKGTKQILSYTHTHTHIQDAPTTNEDTSVKLVPEKVYIGFPF